MSSSIYQTSTPGAAEFKPLDFAGEISGHPMSNLAGELPFRYLFNSYGHGTNVIEPLIVENSRTFSETTRLIAIVRPFRESDAFLVRIREANRRLADPIDDDGELTIVDERARASAIRLLNQFHLDSDESLLVAIGPPDIDGLPNGSVDIFWRYSGRQLLLNVQTDGEYYTFSGIDSVDASRQVVGKELVEEDGAWLLRWLKEKRTSPENRSFRIAKEF